MTATIDYDLPIANFIDGLSATGHVTHVKYQKTSVTFHHNGGRLSLQGILDVWKTRPASAHFQSDITGRLGQYVDVNEYAWATGNTLGNQRSISIEMADMTTAPDWRVAEVTWRSAARLAGWLFANVIKAAPTRENVFVHHHWKSTDCAGPYIDSIFDDLLAEVQACYKAFIHQTTPEPAEELSVSDVQKILEYQKACTVQIQNNFRQLLNNAVEALKDNQQAMAVANNNFVRQTDSGSDTERRAELDAAMAKAQADFDAKLDALKNATLSVPEPDAPAPPA